MHFDMHVCLLEQVLLCSFDSKNILEVEKWAQFDPQNGVQKWHPKGWPNILLVKKKIYKKSKLYLKYWVSLLGAIFGPHFGGQILAPFLGPFFNLHFGVQKWCKFCKSFCCQSCIAKLFPANKHGISKCICGHFPANCISQHNSILHLVQAFQNNNKF